MSFVWARGMAMGTAAAVPNLPPQERTLALGSKVGAGGWVGAVVEGASVVEEAAVVEGAAVVSVPVDVPTNVLVDVSVDVLADAPVDDPVVDDEAPQLPLPSRPVSLQSNQLQLKRSQDIPQSVQEQSP